MPDKPHFTGGYAPLHAYIAPLRPEMWRTLVGVVVMTLVYLGGVAGYFLALAFGLGIDVNGVATGNSPINLIILLSSFAFMAIGAAVAALWPARRAVLGLIGPWGGAKRDFWRVMAAMVPIIGLAYVLTWALDPSLAPNLTFSQALPWLPLAIAGLFIQVSAEELAFRGYIMGQLAARFISPLAWMILPSALFGLVHYDAETYGNAAWVVCLVTMVWAIAISDLTARTGNLGAAVAIHFGNNFLAMILVGEKGMLNGLALNTIVQDYTDPMTIVAQFLFILVFWLAARWVLKV